MAIVLSNYFMEQAITDLVASGLSGSYAGILAGAKIIPYTANITPNYNTVLADLHIATAPGIVPQAAVFGSVYRKTQGGFGTQSNLCRFSMSDNTTPTQVWGYAVTDSSVTNLLFSEVLPNGNFNFNDTFDQLGISTEFVLGGLDYGTALIER